MQAQWSKYFLLKSAIFATILLNVGLYEKL